METTGVTLTMIAMGRTARSSMWEWATPPASKVAITVPSASPTTDTKRVRMPSEK